MYPFWSYFDDSSRAHKVHKGNLSKAGIRVSEKLNPVGAKATRTWRRRGEWFPIIILLIKILRGKVSSTWVVEAFAYRLSLSGIRKCPSVGSKDRPRTYSGHDARAFLKWHFYSNWQQWRKKCVDLHRLTIASNKIAILFNFVECVQMPVWSLPDLSFLCALLVFTSMREFCKEWEWAKFERAWDLSH